eukprot:3453051-Alexandrium_andersonii.AAC.1
MPWHVYRARSRSPGWARALWSWAGVFLQLDAPGSSDLRRRAPRWTGIHPCLPNRLSLQPVCYGTE